MSSKLAILSEVMRRENSSFRTADIVYETDLSRQLVHYHLNELVGQGVLNKVNSRYVVASKDALRELFVTQVEPDIDIQRPSKHEIIFNKTDTERINKLTNTLIYCKVLGIPYSTDAFGAWTDELDSAIKLLKGIRKWYFNNNIQSRRTSAAWFGKKDIKPESMWEMFEKLGILMPMTKEEWIGKFEEIIEDNE